MKYYYKEVKRSVKTVRQSVSEDIEVLESTVVEFSGNCSEDGEDIMTEDENPLPGYLDRRLIGEGMEQTEGEVVSLDISLTDQIGYTWGSESKYWVMWTLWEQSVFEGLKPLSKMWHDETHNMTREEFSTIINQGFLSVCSDPSFKPLKSQMEMRQTVIRLVDYEKNKEPFKILSQTIEMNAVEMVFGRTISFRFQPITLIACAGLAEILRAVCKDEDFLLIAGTYKRMVTSNGKCVLLLNFDNRDGRLQILRLSFWNLKIPIYMVEKIKPTVTEKRYQFKYFVRGADNITRKESSRHKNFIWINSQELQREKKDIPFQEFPIPIQHDEDPVEAYKFLLGDIRRQHLCSAQANEVVRDSPVFFSRPRTSPTIPLPRILSPSKRGNVRPGGIPHPTRSQSPADIWTLNPVVHRTMFFEICGKISVCMFFGLFCLAVFLLLYTPPPPQCSNKPVIESNDPDENVFENRLSYLFVKCFNILEFIGTWIQENCGWNCLLKRLQLSVSNPVGPVV